MYQKDGKVHIEKGLFPSPYGDYGSYLAEAKAFYENIGKLFPSPYGDYGSYPKT